MDRHIEWLHSKPEKLQKQGSSHSRRNVSMPVFPRILSISEHMSAI